MINIIGAIVVGLIYSIGIIAITIRYQQSKARIQKIKDFERLHPLIKEFSIIISEHGPRSMDAWQYLRLHESEEGFEDVALLMVKLAEMGRK